MAAAIKLTDGMMILSFFLTSILFSARSIAAVPLEHETEYFAFVYLENEFSNFLTYSPLVINFEFNAFLTSCKSDENIFACHMELSYSLIYFESFFKG